MNEVASLDKLAMEIRFYSQRTAESVIEIGRRLLLAKQQVAHGEWGKWLQEQVGYTERMAQKFMQCAEKFGNHASTHDLPIGHMFELLALPEGQREEFMKENDVSAMTQKQLREAIKAQKDAEQRAMEAERDKNAAQTLAAQLKTQVNQLAHSEDKLKTQVGILEDKLKSAGEPVIVEQPVQIYPPDYERVKRENAEYKAREQSISLQQLAQKDEEYRQYRKTEKEEKKLADVVSKALHALLDLPEGPEAAEAARCYLKYSPADTMDEILVTCSDLNDGMKKLEQLKKALLESKTLRVVK